MPSVLGIPAVFGMASVLGIASVRGITSVLGVGFLCSWAAPRVEGYQHLLPSWPGARNVHDGQAVGFSCRTASAEARQSNAYPRGIEVNITDAATNACKHIEMDAGVPRRSKFLASRDTRNIFMRETGAFQVSLGSSR
jgi:hypothetical protein